MESALEACLVKRMKEQGAMVLKLSPPPAGLPDRLVLLPGGRCVFIEVKDGSKGCVSPIQEHMLSVLGGLGFSTSVVRTREDIEALIRKGVTDVADVV